MAPGEGLRRAYAPDEDPPLGSYAALTAVFNAALGAALVSAGRRGRLPERPAAGDLLLAGVATHKLSRLIGKDRVLSFARAPFTRYEGTAGPSELSETPRGHGPRRALGELLSCPYCIGQWVAGGMVAGLLHAPRTTRAVASVYALLTVSDFLQLAWKAAEEEAL